MKRIKIIETGCFQDGAAYPIFQKGEVLNLKEELADRIVGHGYAVEVKKSTSEIKSKDQQVEINTDIDHAINNKKMQEELDNKSLESELNKDGF